MMCPTIGFGRTAVSSLRREPKPPAKITAFIAAQRSRRPRRSLVRSALGHRRAAEQLTFRTERLREVVRVIAADGDRRLEAARRDRLQRQQSARAASREDRPFAYAGGAVPARIQRRGFAAVLHPERRR